MKTAILKHLDIASSLVFPSERPPHDYQSLKDDLVMTELAIEVASLRALFKRDTGIEEAFKTCCLKRSQLIEGTSLSYFEMPEGACNRLYWDIAMLLFSPRTMQDMLAILVPELTQVVSIELKGRSSNPKQLQVILNLTEMRYLGASVPPITEDLGHYVVRNKQLLDARNIECFNFPLHQQCYQVMHRDYPDLAIELYQHNPHLKRLGEDILTCSGKGCSIIQRVRDFILILRLGGSQMTGSSIASIDAQQAFTDFLGYLTSLPEETQLALNTLASQRLGRHNFAAVIDDLKGENCIENAARELQMIIDEPQNATFLSTHPHLPQDYLERIHKQYQPKKVLPTIAQSYERQLPKMYLIKALKIIKIRSVSDYLDLLLNFPLAFYKDLLTYATIRTSPLIPVELTNMMRDGVFNQAQQDALKQAFLASYEKFNLDLSFIKYAIESKDPLLLSFIKNLSTPERSKLISQKDNYGNTIFHIVASFPESLKTTLELLPESDRIAAVQQKDNNGSTLLHLVADQPDSFRMILALYPESAQLVAVQQKNNNGYTVLHLAASSPNSLRIVLELHPEEARYAALMQRDNENYHVIGIIIRFRRFRGSPEIFQIILELLPKHDRILAIYMMVYNAIDFSDMLKIVLESAPEAELISALQLEQSNSHDTLLDFLVNRDSDDLRRPRLKTLWRTLSIEARDQLKVSVSKRTYHYFYFNTLASVSGIFQLLGIYLYSQLPSGDIGPFMLIATGSSLLLGNYYTQFFSRQRAARAEEVLAEINRVAAEI